MDLPATRLVIAAVLIGGGLVAIAIVDRQLFPAWLDAGRRRALVHGFVLAGWLYTTYHIGSLVAVGGLAADARFYWAVNVDAPYIGRYGDNDVVTLFPYSPAAALVMAPFALLPWPVFVGVWTVLLLVVAAWLAGRSLLLWLAFPPLAWLLGIGNIELLMAAAVVIGFRWPAAWAVILLTKVTPGIGLLWFVARREWRNLAIALGATAAIVGVTAIFLSQQWTDWLGFLFAGRDQVSGWVPLVIRLPAAALLVVWGARTDRRWTVLVAMLLAVPHFWFATAGGLVALSRPELARS